MGIFWSGSGQFTKDDGAEVSLGSMPMGSTAMVGSESTFTTIEKGKPVVLRSREMLTLKKAGSRWLIVSVQWESVPMP